MSVGIWHCKKCGAKFTNKAYTVGKVAPIKKAAEGEETVAPKASKKGSKKTEIKAEEPKTTKKAKKGASEWVTINVFFATKSFPLTTLREEWDASTAVLRLFSKPEALAPK